jgi:AraC-like DNA-binding protein
MYDWIAEHCTYLAISIAHIARHFGVSVREVYRRSSKVPQEVTFRNVLLALCMAAAVRMPGDLRFSVLTISEIGYHLGFSELSYFDRMFREMQRCSPGEFVKVRQQQMGGAQDRQILLQ